MTKRPLYKKVREKLTRSLVAGEWRPGEILPSEPQLAERYGVGISTIRAAVSELEKAKVLLRAQGKGTFVLHFDDRDSTHRFLNIVRNDNGATEVTHRTMLSFEKITAPDDVADSLQLPRVGTVRKVFRMETLVRLAGTPSHLTNVFLPVGMFPRLRKGLFPDGSRALYSIYQEHFNINVTKVIDSLNCVPGPAGMLRSCALNPGSWVLRLRRVALTYNDLPVEVRDYWIDTTNHSYRIEQGDRS